MAVEPQRQWNPHAWRRTPYGIDWFRWLPAPMRPPEMMTYPYPIRRQAGTVWARLILPVDLSAREAQRIGQMLLTLPIPAEADETRSA